MKIETLVKNFCNNRKPRPKKVGRYSASQVYEIISGKLLPSDFFKQKKFDLFSSKNISEGQLREEGLKWLFDGSKLEYEYQIKIVKKFKDFEIVCVADFVFPEFVLECKCPMKMSGIKDYHRPQLEIQHRFWGKDVYVIYLKEYWENQVFKYQPDDKLWEEILKRVEEFHLQLKQLNNK